MKKSEVLSAVRHRVLRYLTICDMSQRNFAIRCGINVATVNRILAGKHVPSLRVAMAIAKELGMSLNELTCCPPKEGVL